MPVIRKSNGDDRNGRSSGEAYSVPENSDKSDQSAGDASLSSARLAMTTPATTATASAYPSALDERFRQSSSGPASSASAIANTMSASDTDARRHRSRVRARSAASSVAVKRRAPDGAATSKVPSAGVVLAASNRSSMET